MPTYRGDEMQKGQALHPPLMAAFERFTTAEERLRAEVEAAGEEQDRQALATPGLGKALAELRIRTGAVLRPVNVPWTAMAAVDSGRFAAGRQAFSRALAAAQLASDDAQLARVIDAGRAFEQEDRASRRLGPGAQWSAADRRNLAGRLSESTVAGAPAAVSRRTTPSPTR